MPLMPLFPSLILKFLALVLRNTKFHFFFQPLRFRKLLFHYQINLEEASLWSHLWGRTKLRWIDCIGWSLALPTGSIPLYQITRGSAFDHIQVHEKKSLGRMNIAFNSSPFSESFSCSSKTFSWSIGSLSSE